MDITNTNRARVSHCSYCNETNHNFRTCNTYIESIHQELLNTYMHSPNTRTIIQTNRISVGHLRLLAIKIGFRVFNPRIEMIRAYLESLHHFYVQLTATGRQELRMAQIDRYLARGRRIPPSLSLTSDLVPVQLYYPQYDTPTPLPMEVEEQPKRKTTVELHLEPTKFNLGETDSSGDCPVCYESSTNMVMTKCNHLFCQTCMLQMIRLNCFDLSCALCRRAVKDIYVHSDTSMDLMFRG